MALQLFFKFSANNTQYISQNLLKFMLTKKGTGLPKTWQEGQRHPNFKDSEGKIYTIQTVTSKPERFSHIRNIFISNKGNKKKCFFNPTKSKNEEYKDKVDALNARSGMLFRSFCSKTKKMAFCPPPPKDPEPQEPEYVQVKLNVKEKLKKLPILKPMEKCGADPPPLKDIKPLSRLIPKPVPEPTKVCPVEIPCEEKPRADNHLKFVPKKLPKMDATGCSCVNPPPLKEAAPLKRLPKIQIPENRVCKVEVKCDMPRADDGLKLKERSFRKIVPGECPPVEIKFRDPPPLKRLASQPIPEPIKNCKKCVGAECCPPRADKDFKLTPKALPIIGKGSCPCVNPDMPAPGEPLKRLPKREVPEPLKVCPPPPICDKVMDPVGNKKLPVLPTNKCPCVNPEIPSYAPTMVRLPKCPEVDPPKVCPVDDFCETNPRADRNNWSYYVRKNSLGSNIPIASPNDSKRSYSTNLDCPDKTESLLLQNNNCKFRNDSNSFGSRTQNRNEVDNFNSIVQIIVQCIETTKNVLIKPIITLFHQFSYISNMERNCRHYFFNYILKNGPEKTEKPFKQVFKLSMPSIINNNQSKKFASENVMMESFNKDSLSENQLLYNGKIESMTNIKMEGSKTMATSTKQTELQIKSKDEKVTKKKIEEMQKTCKSCCEGAKTKVYTMSKPKCYEKTFWEKIVNYFKARPCPSVEEFRMIRLREEAEKAAKKAGLCLYDPRFVNTKKKALPKIITVNDCKKPKK